MIYFKIVKDVRCEGCDGTGMVVDQLEGKEVPIECHLCHGDCYQFVESKLSLKELKKLLKEEK